jgi:hypothetical protein
MHLDTEPVNIPSDLVKNSQVLMDAMSCVDDSGHLTLPAPKEWLQAWMACYGGEQERLRCAGIKVVVNCLLVRCRLKSAAPVLLGWT